MDDRDFTGIPAWPVCVFPGCQHGRCFALESLYCWPHSNRPTDMIAKELSLIIDKAGENEKAKV